MHGCSSGIYTTVTTGYNQTWLVKEPNTTLRSFVFGLVTFDYIYLWSKSSLTKPIVTLHTLHTLNTESVCFSIGLQLVSTDGNRFGSVVDERSNNA